MHVFSETTRMCCEIVTCLSRRSREKNDLNPNSALASGGPPNEPCNAVSGSGEGGCVFCGWVVVVFRGGGEEGGRGFWEMSGFVGVLCFLGGRRGEWVCIFWKVLFLVCAFHLANVHLRPLFQHLGHCWRGPILGRHFLGGQFYLGSTGFEFVFNCHP